MGVADAGRTPDERPRQVMAEVLKYLRYTGMWATDNDGRLYRLYWHAVAVGCYVATTMMCYAYVDSSADKALLIENTGHVLTILPTSVGVASIHRCRRAYAGIVSDMRSRMSGEVPDAADQRISAALRSAVSEERRIVATYAPFIVGIMYCYLLKPLLAIPGRAEEPARADLPFFMMPVVGCDTAAMFAVEYCFQVVISSGLLFSLISVDLLSFSLIRYASHEFHVLSLVVEDLGKRQHAGPRNQDDVTLTIEARDKLGIARPPNHEVGGPWRRDPPGADLEESLHQLVRRHQAVILNVDKIRDILSPVLFAHYIMSSLTMCLVGYQIALTEDQSQLLTNAMHLSGLVFRLYILCMFSSEVMHQSSCVGQAVYRSDWRSFSQDSKVILGLMMCRSQRPAVIRASKFAILSLKTFSGLLRTAYSYYTLLKDLNST